LLSYAILTTVPNELLRLVHCPSSCGADEERWLSPDEAEPDRLLPLLVPYPAGEMEGYVVSTRVNGPANDTPELLARAASS
jgi:putative SOS response-associated peptidase YedK